jgi:protein-L-isoaspartate(D-aspartate) O-methyltransferase
MTERTAEDRNQLVARWNRAKEMIARKDLTRRGVIEAFLRTPRENFTRDKNRTLAYVDNFVDIGYGQTIYGPHLRSEGVSGDRRRATDRS